MTRLAFAMALGGLARARGEDLLRVKGLVLFDRRPGVPAAIHAVQHTLYPPDWLAAWPDEDHSSRLVFIVRDIRSSDNLRTGSPQAIRFCSTRDHHNKRRGLMLDLVIANGTCVLPSGTIAADIGVAGGKIVAIGAPGRLAAANRTVDATGGW